MQNPIFMVPSLAIWSDQIASFLEARKVRTGGASALERAAMSMFDHLAMGATGLLEIGTEGYHAREKRRLMCVNAGAHAATLVGLILLANYVFTDPALFRWVIAINILMIVVSLITPLLHRVGPSVGSAVLIFFADVNLFAVAAMLGRDSGLHLLMFAAPALIFIMFGLDRIILSIVAVVASLIVYLIAQWNFTHPALEQAISPAFLYRLHVISASA